MKYTIATYYTFLLATLIITTFAQNQVVNVGEGGLKYNPPAITATPGSTITFAWINTIQHSVIQSDSADSCTPTAGGFNMQMKAGETWNLTVPADKPKIWFYCNISTHCQQGMKGVLTVSGVDSPDPDPQTPDPPTHSKPPTAKIAGIVVASLVLVGVILGLIYYRKRRRGDRNDGGNTRHLDEDGIGLIPLSSAPSFQYPDPDSEPCAEPSAPFSEKTSPLHRTDESITSSLATSADNSKMTVTLPPPVSAASTDTSNGNRHNGLIDAIVKDLSNYKSFERESIFAKRRAPLNVSVFRDQFEISNLPEWKYTRMSLDRYIAPTGKSGSTERITRLPDCRPLINILSTYLIIERLKASKAVEKYRNSSESMMKCAQAPRIACMN